MLERKVLMDESSATLNSIWIFIKSIVLKMLNIKETKVIEKKTKEFVQYEYLEKWVDVKINLKSIGIIDYQYEYQKMPFEFVGGSEMAEKRIGGNYFVYKYGIESFDYVNKNEKVILIGKEIVYEGYFKRTVVLMPEIRSPIDGILEIIIEEGHPVYEGESICRIHYDLDDHNVNSPQKEKYEVRFNELNIGKYQLNILRNENSTLIFKNWLVDKGSWIEKGSPIYEVKCNVDRNEIFCEKIAAKANGIIELRYNLLGDLYTLRNRTLMYTVYKNKEAWINCRYSNKAVVIFDEFSKEKTVKWKKVGGISLPNIFNEKDRLIEGSDLSFGAIINNSEIGRDLLFSFENHNGRDFIVFYYHKDDIKISRNDYVEFLFDNDEILSFNIQNQPIKHLTWKDVSYTLVPISVSELNEFLNNEVKKWRVKFDKTGQIVVGRGGCAYYGDDYSLVIRKFAMEYIECIRQNVENHKVIVKIEKEVVGNIKEGCYVYLMIDRVNQYCKIGISNNPDYREKTLQSDKPTIELVGMKKFPSRRIAESIEKALHGTFNHKRIRGEWFDLDEEEVEEVKNALK